MDTETGQGQFVKSEKEIRRLLRQAQSSYSPVTVHCQGSKAFYTSYVVELSDTELMLDELVPESGNMRLTGGEQFTIETFVDGIRVRAMHLSAKPSKASDGGDVYSVPLPSEVHILQRRQSYRVPLRKTLEIPVDFAVSRENVHSGMLVDFSMEGCQVALQGDLYAIFEPLIKPINSRMRFPNGDALRAKVRPQRVRYDDVLDKTYVGVQFMQLTSEQVRYITFLFAELQRDHINAIKNGAHPSGVPDIFRTPELPQAPQAEPSQSQNTPKQTADPSDPPVKKQATPLRQAVPSGMALENACVAVKMLLREAGRKQAYDKDLVVDAAKDLLSALKLERNAIMLRLCVRRFHEQWVEHSVAVAVWFTDLMMARQPELSHLQQINIMVAGLVHALPRLQQGSGIDWFDLPESVRENLVLRTSTTRRALQDQGFPKEADIIVSQVLERCDGSGLPAGIDDEQQHGLAKAASMIDAFAMLAYSGEYDQYYQPVVAYRKLLRMTEQFDQTLVKQFVSRIGVMPVGSCVQLDNQLIGVVLSLGKQKKPDLLRVLVDATTKKQVAPADIRLQPPLTIAGLVDPAKYKLSSEHLLPLPELT